MDADALISTDPIPSVVNASSAVAKRLEHVSDLIDVIQHGGREKRPRTAVQRLPRHMRRRAMSHNVKRLPRNTREFGQAVIAKSKHRKKPPSRMRRRRPNNLQKEYSNRSVKRDATWLHTHIFHAKRFQMVNLWGHKLPLRSYQRGIRPFLRASRDQAVVFDDSYNQMFVLVTNHSDQMKRVVEKIAELKRHHYFSVMSASCPGRFIQVVYESDLKLVLSIHPLYSMDVVAFFGLLDLNLQDLEGNAKENAIKEAGFVTEKPKQVLKGDGVTVFAVSNVYGQLTLYGATALKSLNYLFCLVSDAELVSNNFTDYKPHHDQWSRLVNGNTIGHLKDNTAFSILVEDARLQKAVKLSRELAPSNTGFNDDQLLKPMQTLFDRSMVEVLLSKKLSQAEIAKLNATRLTKVTVSGFKIPVFIVIRTQSEVPRVECYMPAQSIRPFLATFYRSGIPVGSITDRFVLSVENQDLTSPFVWIPLKTPKPLYRWVRYKRVKDVKFENLNEWNDLQWDHIIDAPEILHILQQALSGKIQISHGEFPSRTLLPVQLTILEKTRIHDNAFIYEFGNMAWTSVPPNKKPRAENLKTPDTPKEKIIGRIVYARTSLLHGCSEAFGYVDLAEFSSLVRTKGIVYLAITSDAKMVKAGVKMCYTK